jgi:hypothetical protein
VEWKGRDYGTVAGVVREGVSRRPKPIYHRNKLKYWFHGPVSTCTRINWCPKRKKNRIAIRKVT